MMVNLPCLMVSCTNFLRPTCSYTECQLSFQTGSCPTERTTASYSSCLFLIFTGLLLTSGKLIFSGRSPLFHLLVLFWCSASHTSSGFTGFLSRTLLDLRFIWNPTGLWIIIQSVVFMQPVLTPDFFLQCLLTSYSDRMLSPLSGLCKLPSVFCRLSL